MSIGILVVALIQPRMLHSLWFDSIIFDERGLNSKIKKNLGIYVAQLKLLAKSRDVMVLRPNLLK
jgi:hypothetical protein